MTYKFVIKTTHEASEIISDAMFELGSSGVCISDPLDFDEIDKNGIVWDYTSPDDRKGDVTVEGFFDTTDPLGVLDMLNEKINAIKSAYSFDTGEATVTYEIVPDVDWQQEWKKYYKPIVLDKISIIPSWEKPIGDNYIFIEPGQAFGTGEHESTNMCLRLSFKLDLRDKSVADVGCGSGIIGMSALKLGAKSCYFSDLDENALDNLEINLKLNDINDRVTVAHDSLLTHNNQVYDVIFANITADILMLFAPQINDRLAEKGSVVISGIIAEREKEVLDCFDKYGFIPVDSLQMKDWRAFTLVRKNGN